MSAELPKRPSKADLLAMDHKTLMEHVERYEAIQKIASLESLIGFDSFGGSDDYFRLLRDRYGPNGEWRAPLNVDSDRKGGQNRPIVLNETEINFHVQNARVTLAVNPYAEGQHNARLNYIVGKGFTYKSKARNAVGHDGMPRQVDERTKDLVEKVQTWTQSWIARNAWSASVRDPRTLQTITDPREREMVGRTYRDGCAVIRMHLMDDGDSAARFAEPVQITNKPGATEAEGWTFGRRHRIEPFVDVETIESYWIRYWKADGSEDGDDVPADEIIEVKIPGTDRCVKRNVPDYCFGKLRALERAYTLQDTASKTANFRAGNAEYWGQDTVPAPGAYTGGANGTGTGPGGRTPVDNFGPAPRIRHSSGRTPLNPTAAGFTEYPLIAQADLRQAGAPSSMPEFLISGDASNNNYASIQEAGTPFNLAMSVVQEHFAAASLAVIYRALRHAIECKVLPADTLDLVEISAETAKDDARKPLERAQEDQILIATGVKSVQTAQRERGLDPEQQATERQEYEQQFGNGVMPLSADDDPNGPGGGRPQPTPVPESVDLPVYRDAKTRPEVDDVSPLPAHLKDLADKVPGLATVHKGLMLGHHAAQAAAKRVAAERGLTPEQTEALAKRLGHYDMLVSGGVKVAALAGAHGVAPLAAVPAASLGYLTYSTMRDPLATYNAAAKSVKAAFERKTAAPAPTTNPE